MWYDTQNAIHDSLSENNLQLNDNECVCCEMRVCGPQRGVSLYAVRTFLSFVHGHIL